MGMYMYPIKIDREAKEVSYTKEYDLNDLELSLDELKQFMDESETFQINSEERKIHVYGKRLETPDELELRVKKEEGYMDRYNRYHNK